MRAAIFAVACLLLVAATPAVVPTLAAVPPIIPTQAPAPTPSFESPPPMETPPPTPAPSLSPAPAPTLPPTPAPSLSPAPAPTPSILMLPADAPPQILWVSLSSTTLKTGDTVSVVVLTSSNVASVELRIGGYGSGMTKTDVGHFETTSTVPQLPVFVKHKVTLQIIARNTAGAVVTRTVPLQVR